MRSHGEPPLRRRALPPGKLLGVLILALTFVSTGEVLALGRCQPEEYTEEQPNEDPTQLPLCEPLDAPFTQAGLDGAIDTQMVVRFVKRWVPDFDTEAKRWVWRTLVLRGFGLPIDPTKPVNADFPADPTEPITDYFDTDTNLQWVLPGPTFRVRKGTRAGSSDGSRLKLKYLNRLPPVDFHSGHSCNEDFYCAGETYEDENGEEQQCSPLSPDVCDQHPPCKKTPVPQTFPDCFHGNNVTNLHYHGTHVSPQPHQDYVLLSLFPEGSTDVPTDEDEYAVGDYQTDMHPFPWNQAEGTHWYHPHKHGSTALQVLNGLSGALLIRGPFDDWLDGFFCAQPGQDCGTRPALDEQVLVVDQLWGIRPEDPTGRELNLFHEETDFVTDQPLVNGQADPVVLMAPGEIQRFRFIGATMQASAHLELGFEGTGTPELRQIAQDGVQFSRKLYTGQPYRDRDGSFTNFDLAPGNRVDLLVKAPEGRGCFPMTHQMIGNLAGSLQAEQMIAEREDLAAAAAATENPPLLTVCVTGARNDLDFPCGEGESSADCWCPPDGPCWYDEPYSTFLRNVERTERNRSVVFGMTGQQGFGTARGTRPAHPNCFYLANPDLPYAQYDPDCALETMPLTVDGVGERWTVSNTCPANACPNHPFHIHINPFQLVAEWGTVGAKLVSAPGDPGQPRTYDPPIWQDTVALPSPACRDTDAGPLSGDQEAKQKCPEVCQGGGEGWRWNGQWTTTVPGEMSVCGCCHDGYVTIRQRFEDYTGGYVMHCHILGHEDRGMMQNLQTVCGDGDYGTPRTSGGPDDCGQPIQKLPACTDNPTCPVSPTTTSAGGGA